jgi:hypothetical protein
MCSTFGLAFSVSHFIFLFVQAPAKSKGQMSDEELLIISTRICHFLMHEYISPHGAYHIPDGRMSQFLALCNYIQQGQAQQTETHKKFKQICGCP